MGWSLSPCTSEIESKLHVQNTFHLQFTTQAYIIAILFPQKTVLDLKAVSSSSL